MAGSSKYLSEITRLKKLVRSGDAMQISNIAVTYRMAGNRRRAFEWWQRAAAAGNDGDAFLDLGYCYQYGIGVRRDRRAACGAYNTAIRSRWISEYDREEALYHLAVAHLDINHGQRGRRRAAELLRKAAGDGDYPQADDLLGQLKDGEALSVCRCRRFLRRSLGGKAHCSLHARPGRRSRSS